MNMQFKANVGKVKGKVLLLNNVLVYEVFIHFLVYGNTTNLSFSLSSIVIIFYENFAVKNLYHYAITSSHIIKP